MRKIKIHYAWWILFACCALQAGSQGTIFDTSGVFNSPVCKELGFDLGSFTFAQTFSAAAMMIAQPFTTYFYNRVGIKRVLLVSGCFYYLSFFFLSGASALWHWYVLLTIQGIMGGFFYRTSTTILLCRWFVGKTALALGIATAVGSVMGMIMNPFASMIISDYGWRACYMILACLGALITLPLIARVIVESPYACGMKPYVAEEDKNSQTEFKGKFTGKKANLVCILLIGASSVCFMCGGYYSHLPNYSLTIGMGAVAGSLLTSFELGGTMIMKFLIGPLYEKIGLMKSEILLFVLSVAGFSAYFVCRGTILYFTTSLCGIYCATNVVLMPLLAREEVGESKFQQILPWMTTTGAALSSISNNLYGIIYDTFQSYDLMFVLCIIGMCCSFCLIIVIKYMGMKQTRENSLWKKS